MRITSPPPGFYVYAYLREVASPHGDVGTPYYIGKGIGKRAWVKFKKETKPPRNHSNVKIIASNLAEADAFQLEMLLIFLYGRVDLNSGCLRNKTDGGEGWVGISRSPEWRASQGERSKRRWATSEYRNKMMAGAKERGKRHSQLLSGRKRGPSPLKGKKFGPMSDETKAKLSLAKKGTVPWNKGKKKNSESSIT